MVERILVTGGTGNLGRHVVPLLQAEGAEVRTLSRRGGTGPGVEHRVGDLLRNELGTSLNDIDTVLHLAGGWKGDDRATANLVRAADAAGVRHLVFISVIGADAVPLTYQRAKRGSEAVIEASGIPWTILRAAQFHDLVRLVAGSLTRLPIAIAPGEMRAEPVDVDEVAARLAALTLGEPAGRVPELAGPRVYAMRDLVRTYLEASGRQRPVVQVRIPGAVGRAYRAGANLARPGAERGAVTWEEYLRSTAGDTVSSATDAGRALAGRPRP